MSHTKGYSIGKLTLCQHTTDDDDDEGETQRLVLHQQQPTTNDTKNNDMATTPARVLVVGGGVIGTWRGDECCVAVNVVRRIVRVFADVHFGFCFP